MIYNVADGSKNRELITWLGPSPKSSLISF